MGSAGAPSHRSFRDVGRGQGEVGEERSGTRPEAEEVGDDEAPGADNSVRSWSWTRSRCLQSDHARWVADGLAVAAARKAPRVNGVVLYCYPLELAVGRFQFKRWRRGGPALTCHSVQSRLIFGSRCPTISTAESTAPVRFTPPFKLY